jgi:histidyl-tRNA synthetase
MPRINNKDADLEHPKGMPDILGSDFYHMQGFFEKSQEVAMYYGFDPIDTPILEHQEIWLRSSIESDVATREMYTLATKGGDKLALRPERTTAIMRAYIQHGMRSWSQPVMLYHYGPTFRYEKPAAGRYRQFHSFDMDILGTEAPIADAIIIQSTMKILAECGAPSTIFVEINSLGDADSRKELEKELRNYYKKHSDKMSANDREKIKTNVLRILDSKESATIEINQNAPKSIDFLTTASKKHFKAVLEHLDELGIPYRINHNLVRGMDYYTHTVFEVVEPILDPETNTTRTHSIVGGGRYDYLAQMMGHKKEVPAVGVGIGAERILAASWWKGLTPRIVKPANIYFIQIGTDAKLKSLAIVDELRKAKIPVLQALSKDKLSIQMTAAEKSEVDCILIFGQREALDNTIIIRNVKTQSQKTVKLGELIETLKKMK